MPYAPGYVQRQQTAAVALSTEDWSLVDAQIRERAFFMAGVDNGRILARFQEVARRLAAGELSLAEARREMRETLAAMGYEPESADDVGGIHDLRSRRRLDVTLQTNADMAAGWAQRRQALGDITNPGQELYRALPRRAHRDWTARWIEAAQACAWEGVARDGSFRALVTSPIWARLSRFGYPYPPFDFNSGMRVRPVSFGVCRDLGLITGPEFMDAMEQEQARDGLNEGTEVDCRELPAEILQQVDAALGSVGDIVDGVARARDINGTTPYSADKLAQVLTEPMPEGVPNVQRAALDLYTKDPAKLPLEAEPALKTALDRIKPYQDAPDLHRSMDLTPEQARTFSESIERDGYTAAGPSQPFGLTPAATPPTPGCVRIALRWVGATTARDLRPLRAALDAAPEDALHLLRGYRLRVVGKETKGDVITYTVSDAATQD